MPTLIDHPESLRPAAAAVTQSLLHLRAGQHLMTALNNLNVVLKVQRGARPTTLGGQGPMVIMDLALSERIEEFANAPFNAASELRESVSVIAHELIHALHAAESLEQYRFRNTVDATNTRFPNQEEELTITGKVLAQDVPGPLFENRFREELDLPLR